MARSDCGPFSDPILTTSCIRRDMLKTWLQSNDIKDKSALMENRKLIEVVS